MSRVAGLVVAQKRAIPGTGHHISGRQSLRGAIVAKCIYCSSEADSEEHHLPYALGKFKGYVPLLDRVCSSCNGKCGKLDEQLSRTGIEAWHRIRLEITGRKSHEKVNSFYRGSAGGKPIEMTGLNPKTGKAVHLELKGGNKVQELCYAKLTAEDGTDYLIKIPDGMTPQQFKRCVDGLPVKTFKTADISASEEDTAWIEELVRSALRFERPIEWESGALGPILYCPVRVKVSGDARYFRCIAKIGFHYFLTKMTQFRGDEDCFAAIRDFMVKDGTNLDDCARFVSVEKSPLQGVEKLRDCGHILSAEKHDSRLISRVQLFAGPGSLGRVYCVELGADPSPIFYNKWFGDFFGYYPKEERGEFDGEVGELI
jgi:hypothetical protein